jgi:Tfp pilus assembly protein PilN
MININFVPDDYVQKKESLRANTFYLVLFLIAMSALAGTFAVIKMRQRAALSEQMAVSKRMADASTAIAQLEELQTKKKQMMKNVLLTAELVEPVPRSIVLAALTNNLPAGTSLTIVDISQDTPPAAPQAAATSKYDAAKKAAGSKKDEPKVSPEMLLVTNIEIEGIAPSDIEVAAYISRLTSSILFEKVALVQSKETSIDNDVRREFKLTAMLKKDIRLSEDDIKNLKVKAETAGLF